MARRKLTSQMSSTELAKIYAEHQGHYGGSGGWIYTAAGKPIIRGWQAYAGRLQQAKIIVVGKGIDWQHRLRSSRS